MQKKENREKKMRADLDARGFAVVRGVWSDEECRRAVLALKDDLTQCHSHSAFMWSIRRDPRILAVFARIWGCDPSDLVTSFDGAGFKGPHDAPFVLDWHFDQNGTHPAGRACVPRGVTRKCRSSAAAEPLCRAI